MKLAGDQQVALSSPAAIPGTPPTVRSMYQSRQNFGVNFGSVFVLEKYIYDKMFIDGASVELDAVKNYIKQHGIDETRKQMEDHWKNYCNDSDWQWLQSKGVQSIRLPLGYWIVGGGRYTKGTSFESVAAVYQNAWTIVVENYVKKAANYRISVLLDLHALPRGANTGDHSGEKLSSAGFWNDSRSISLASEALKYMAQALAPFDNVSGIQIVNESTFDNEARHQKRYYTSAINAIRSVNVDIPIVISDGWWADQWVRWVNEHGSALLGVVIDDHVYRCFSDDDKSKSADQLTQGLDSTVLMGLSGPSDFIIGEYSCVLDGQTWSKTQGSRDDHVRQYGQKEVAIFKQRTAGYYFWCFKFEHGDGGEWGFKPMVDRGFIPSRNSRISRLPDQNDYNQTLNQLYSGHEQYWNSQNPHESYEHWRYKEGFTTAWADCTEFAKFDNSRIGRKCAWKAARRQEHIAARGNSRFLWEWEQGFDKAIEVFTSYN